MSSSIALTASAFVLLFAAAAAQLDPATGYIKPTPGVPAFNPADWNSVYKVTICNIPMLTPHKLEYLKPWQEGCNTTGFDTVSSSTVPMRTGAQACFYQRHTDEFKFDYWRKERGLAYSQGNCYCYALNFLEGDSCQPGTSNGGKAQDKYNEKMTCPAMHQAMTDDGAVHITHQKALSAQPETGHYVAMLARPEGTKLHGDGHGRHSVIASEGQSDFHFLRKDASGTWSHKLPYETATDRDLEGKLITDPEAAVLPGHYLVCGYYWVEPEKMPLGMTMPQQGPLSDNYLINVNITGVTFDVSLSPYNHTADGEPWSWNFDLEWERKRGSKEYEEWRQWARKELEIDSMPKASGSKTAEGSSRQGGSVAETAAAAKKAASGRKLKSFL